MFTKAADRAAVHPVPSLAERCGAYEYIWRIHGYFNRGATDRGNSDSDK